jgi:hypothetical protein
MIKNVTVGIMTMAAGDKILGSPIKWTLKNKFKDFEKVVVFDGALDEKSMKFYSTISNVEVVDMPWDDCYVSRYLKFSEMLKDDSWGIWFDCDEFPSDQLISFLKREDLFPPKNLNILYLPCVTLLTEDYKTYAACEEEPGDDPNVWTKHILFKKTDTLTFWNEGSHVVPTHRQYEAASYVPFHYFHMKSLKSFIYNDAWQAFISPKGQGYLPNEEKMFKLFTEVFENTKHFQKATKNGEWPMNLQKFALQGMSNPNKPISRLGWVYWILEGNKYPFSAIRTLPTWDEVKGHVLESKKLDLFEKNLSSGNYIKIEG